MKWHFPLDPECPDVLSFFEAIRDDPMSQECPCLDEIIEDWEDKHRKRCKQCQEYGAANVEVL